MVNRPIETEVYICNDPVALDRQLIKLIDYSGMVARAKINGGREVVTLKETEEAPSFATLSINDMQKMYIAFGKYLKKESQLPLDGAFEHQGKHLEDMRKIAFHKLGIK